MTIFLYSVVSTPRGFMACVYRLDNNKSKRTLRNVAHAIRSPLSDECHLHIKERPF